MSKQEHAGAITLTVVVQGVPVSLKRGANAPISSLVEEALALSKNAAGQPASEWELRDANGNVLDLSRTFADSGIIDGATLYLSLKAGVGGC